LKIIIKELNKLKKNIPKLTQKYKKYDNYFKNNKEKYIEYIILN